MFEEHFVDSKRILYTPSVFARTSLLYLQETGTLKAIRQHSSSRSGLASFLFFVVLDGEGSLNFNKKDFKLKKGDCAFINCRGTYNHSTSNNLWSLQWIHFDGENMLGIYEKFVERGGQPVFRPKDFKEYTDVLDFLFAVASSEDYLRDMKLNEYISQLLTSIMKMSWIPGKQLYKKRDSFLSCSLEKIRDYIDLNWDKKITLDLLAEKFNINKFYMLRLFKNQYGRTIKNYVIEKRITHSKKMLRFSDGTIETIAYTCGFEDSNYFSREFKKMEGMTPLDFRKKWNQ